jgi:hypothetical protein
MKKIYCVEEWWLENEPVRDLFWSNIEEPWKLGRFSFVNEFDDEEKFKKHILSIINTCGVIGKIWIKEEPDNYNASIIL